MHDTDRIIGKLEEFKDWSKREFYLLRREVESLKQFKWQIYGGSAFVTCLLMALVELLKQALSLKSY